MSMMVGHTNSNRVRMQIKDPFTGNVIANISYSKSNKTSYMVKKKRLNYNFKALSNQILRTKTSFGARQAISAARRKVAQLSRNLNSSEYDDEELKSAIIHAKKMERIARKRMKHLKQEEEMARTGKAAPSETKMEENALDGMDMEEMLGMSEEDIQKLMEELEEMMQQLDSGEYTEDTMKDLSDMVLEETDSDMDLERLKKKHRSDELREIVDADIKYLKAMFQKLAREKQALSSTKSSSGSQTSSGGQSASGSSPAPNGVSLEISGSEVPVDAAAVPVAAEGASMDVVV